ncbi:MAG: translation initiation factor [Puniceicoccales bacterium]|jgi:translation initiation factor 1 (eIF-1/SUI1)|nr:translation initiation factor [Puniceicoccales bacterium]
MKSRISADGGQSLNNNPFDALDATNLPAGPEKKPEPPAVPKAPVKYGKVHLRIEKSGRGGKTVTVLFGEGIERLGGAEREKLLRSLKSAMGTGGALGTVEPTLEIQGDERPRIADWLREAGFQCKG